MEFAKSSLEKIFADIKYSPFVWTEPIGISSDKFLNGLAMVHSHYGKNQTLDILKRVERECGSNSEEKRSGLVRMDLDLLQYGREIFHVSDWDRPYVQQLLKELQW